MSCLVTTKSVKSFVNLGQGIYQYVITKIYIFFFNNYTPGILYIVYGVQTDTTVNQGLHCLVSYF